MSGLQLPQAGAGGLVPVTTLQQIQDAEKKQAAQVQQTPMVQGLAGYVRSCFESAKTAKQDIEQRMLKCLRQRRGEYEPGLLADIRKQGGSEIYMMLTSNKCRSAGAWLKEVLFGKKDEACWDVEPTADPELSPEDKQIVVQEATQEAMQMEMQMGGMQFVTPERMREVVMRIRDKTMSRLREEARQIMDRMRVKMSDQLQEGGFWEAMNSFVEDLVTYPFAVIKGPVPRKKKQLKWVQGPQGWTLDIQDAIVLCWDRVDPFMLYWAPHATGVDDGFVIERHKLTRTDLYALIGVEGYNEAAIRLVLADFGKSGLSQWLTIDSSLADATGKSLAGITSEPEQTIDALQYWGNVPGEKLLDFGLDASAVPDKEADYPCEVWVIGGNVIKATINPDPCGRKPYFKTCYEKIPGAWGGNGIADLIRDCQNMCNASARSLSNNMGIASGPMSYVNVERLPPGEDVTQMYPWRVWQVTSDPYGGGSKPVEFFQPSSNAAELMAIYEKFSVLADEYSGVPRYMTGDSPAGGAGRTASGMSMLMNNAGKSMKQVIGNIDIDVTQPLIERQYYYNMKYIDDPALKGDVKVVARGVNMLVAKEQAQVRMNEILNIVVSNPILFGIVGEEMVANLLREVTKPLNMDVVPSKEEVRARIIAREQMAMMQQMLALQGGAGGPDGVNFERDQNGAISGLRVMPRNQQVLMDKRPVTDNFAPSRK